MQDMLEPEPSLDAQPWIRPLDDIYRRLGCWLPPLKRLMPSEVPEPYHQLLVHSQDMTPTLRRFFGEDLTLTPLQRFRHGAYYYREVVLRLKHGGRTVEYGAIKINLELFPWPVREQILEGRRPLGGILQSEFVAHASWPQAFFQVEPDDRMAEALDIDGPRTPLYGRRNLLLNPARKLLADVVEVLPVIRWPDAARHLRAEEDYGALPK